MRLLQLQLFGTYFGTFLPHSYGYEPANELKSVLKPPHFRFGPYKSDSPLVPVRCPFTASRQRGLSETCQADLCRC